MVIPHGLPAALGIAAALATIAILAIHITLAQALSDTSSSIKSMFIVSAALEAMVLIVLCWLGSAYLSPTWIGRARRFSGIWFGASVLLSTVAAAVSVAAVVNFSGTALAPSSKILSASAPGFLVGSAVTLGLSFPVQLVFLVIHFIIGRIRGDDELVSLHAEDGNRSPQPNVKSIPYHETSASVPKGSDPRVVGLEVSAGVQRRALDDGYGELDPVFSIARGSAYHI